MASRGLRKTYFFTILGSVRGEILILFVLTVVQWVRRSLHSAYINRFLTDPLHIRKNTQKSKFLLSQAFKWKKIMFFVIPEMPSKTFVMVLKKLPDHFNALVNQDANVRLEEMMLFFPRIAFTGCKSLYGLSSLLLYLVFFLNSSSGFGSVAYPAIFFKTRFKN